MLQRKSEDIEQQRKAGLNELGEKRKSIRSESGTEMDGISEATGREG